jgi:hypothetical protein
MLTKETILTELGLYITEEGLVVIKQVAKQILEDGQVISSTNHREPITDTQILLKAQELIDLI